MKPISQFRNLAHFHQVKSSNLSSQIVCDYPVTYAIKLDERPESIDPGREENICNRIIHHAYPSTETNSFINVEKTKPDLGGSGLTAMTGDAVPPIIAYPELNANDIVVGSETSMGYSAGGFVKIPRSLFVHPAWEHAKLRHRHIFLEFLFRAAWAPTFFYWMGNRLDLGIGQLYFSRKKLSEQLSVGSESEDQISEGDIRGALRYFQKVNFLTSALTRGLTNGPTIVTILYPSFSEEEKTLNNQSSNQCPNQRLTSASPIKEEDKEHKERRKNKSPLKTAAVDNAEALRLCSNFIELLEKTLPGLKLPKSLAKWQSEFDLLLRIDGRSVQDVEFLFAKMPGHFYSKNVQCPSKFREKFPVLMAYHTDQQSSGDCSVNRSWFLETKKDNVRELRDWTASGEWVLNSRNAKEISLKMGHSEFKKAFLSACGGKEVG